MIDPGDLVAEVKVQPGVVPCYRLEVKITGEAVHQTGAMVLQRAARALLAHQKQGLVSQAAFSLAILRHSMLTS